MVEQVPGRTHKACFPVGQTSSPTNRVLIMPYLSNASLNL